MPATALALSYMFLLHCHAALVAASPFLNKNDILKYYGSGDVYE
jgi:hypothetical protein